ncbi:MAG TPA: BAX inhibitor protein, partial [Halieaceae bacterium]|nr:BAX inhibitor protein [Halieaceae bacterium]
MSERRVDVATSALNSVTVETNKILRNTYMLLGMTLAFSALTASVSMVLNLPLYMYWVFALTGLGLLFVVHRMADSAKGLPA